MLKPISERVMVVRLRTWALTITTTVLIVLYIFVTLSIRGALSLIDFIFTVAIQITTHFAYFPDGEQFGEKDAGYIGAKDAYDKNANAIIEQNFVHRLREYCEFEYEERKREYITTKCGEIGVSYDEFCELKKKSKEEIDALDFFEYGGNKIFFTKRRKKLLKNLIFDDLPVKPNAPDVILSAVDRDPTAPIKDESAPYKKTTHGITFFKVIVAGLILAYIAYGARDGITLSAVVKAVVFLWSMVSSAVTSFIEGEKASRELKKKFFVELTVFIGKFASWLHTEKNETLLSAQNSPTAGVSE